MAGAAAAGVQAGAAFGPWGAAIGGLAGMASDAANSPAGPSSASQYGSTSGMFDGSNWNINFKGTQTNTTTRSGPQQSGAQVPDMGILPSFTGGAGQAGQGQALLIAGVIIVGALLWKKR